MDKLSLLIKKMESEELVLALAESMTCGLASYKLSSRFGTSQVFAGSIVCYTPEVKNKLLGVSKRKISTYTCESEEITEILARNLQKVIEADIYAAVTGLASPGGSETKEKPVGTVFFSVYYRDKVYNLKKMFRGKPLQIKKKACDSLFEFILAIVNDKRWSEL